MTIAQRFSVVLKNSESFEEILLGLIRECNVLNDRRSSADLTSFQPSSVSTCGMATQPIGNFAGALHAYSEHKQLPFPKC